MTRIKTNTQSHRIQWMSLWVVVVTIGLGWRYPLLGYSVPLVMIMGIAVAIFRGRYACGNLCPRGSFLDRIISRISPQRKIPSFFRNMVFRWTVLVLLMGFMMYRGMQQPTDLNHWGYVFWTMCVVTTIVALGLSLSVNSRTWCSFCPMGTLQNIIGGDKEQLFIDGEACKGCKLCEKVCTLTLPITNHKEQGTVVERDCVKCSECIEACPVNALSWHVKPASYP